MGTTAVGLVCAKNSMSATPPAPTPAVHQRRRRPRLSSRPKHRFLRAAKGRAPERGGFAAFWRSLEISHGMCLLGR
jgi:hypothetical protein